MHSFRHDINIPTPLPLLPPRRPTRSRSRRSSKQIINTRGTTHTRRRSTRRRTSRQRHTRRPSTTNHAARPTRWPRPRRRTPRTRCWRKRRRRCLRLPHWWWCYSRRRRCRPRRRSGISWGRVGIDPAFRFGVVVEGQLIAKLAFVHGWLGGLCGAAEGVGGGGGGATEPTAAEPAFFGGFGVDVALGWRGVSM